MERVDNVMNFLNSHIRDNFSSLQDCNLVELINQSLDMTKPKGLKSKVKSQKSKVIYSG